MRKPAGAAAPLIWVQPPPPPRQRSLGREEIVAAAIALADEAGPAALTMKAVAARLGPYSAMALYRCEFPPSVASISPNRDSPSRMARLGTWSVAFQRPSYAERVTL